jgi:hypothetical protein
MANATTMRPSLPMRLASAVPDSVAAGFFLILWVAPGLLGPKSLNTGLLIMLVEFVLIHASGMTGGIMLSPKLAPMQKLKVLLGFAAFYLIFILTFCFAFKAWWPLAAFAVLLLGKASLAFDRELPNAERQHRMSSGWALSCGAYLGGVFLTLFLPVPRLGLTSAVVAEAGLTGSGHWIDHPQTVVAFGVIYFGFLAWTKAIDLRLPGTNQAATR